MMASRITPGVVWTVLATAFSVALIDRAGGFLGFWQRSSGPELGYALLTVATYTVSFLLCLRIARDHKGSRAMHLAWLLFAGSSAMSVIRHSLYFVMVSGLFPEFRGAASYIPIQLPMAIALVLLFGGLLAMWSAFSALGLGFHAKRSDIVLITLMLIMVTPILIRNPERIRFYVSGWVYILPYAGAILLPACAAIAVLLHRITMQMGGGETARALRYLIWFPAMRLAAMLISVDPHLNVYPVLTTLGHALFQSAPLIFTLAVAYRWQITVKASVAVKAERAQWPELFPIETPVA